MKKILAILLAVSMLVAFAACGTKTQEETTTEEITEEITEEVTEEVTEEATSEDVTVAPAEDASTTEAASEDASEATSESETESTTEEDKTPKTTEEIVAFYNAARKATKPAPKGHQTMVLVGDITGDGFMGAILGALTPAAKSALEKNSKDTDWIPAADHNDILPSDVTSAKATTKNGVTTVELKFKDQVDGPDTSKGPVERGISTLGSIDSALSEMGAEITEGRDTVKLTYTDAYLTAKIKDGKIIGGTWHYTVKIFVGEAKAKLGISATLKNLKAAVDYKVVI